MRCAMWVFAAFKNGIDIYHEGFGAWELCDDTDNVPIVEEKIIDWSDYKEVWYAWYNDEPANYYFEEDELPSDIDEKLIKVTIKLPDGNSIEILTLEWDGNVSLECEAGNLCVEYTKVTKNGQEILDSEEIEDAGINLKGW